MGQDSSRPVVVYQGPSEEQIENRVKQRVNFWYNLTLIRLGVMIYLLWLLLSPIQSLMLSVDFMFYQPIRYGYVWWLDQYRPYDFLVKCYGTLPLGECWELSRYVPTDWLQNCYQQQISVDKCQSLIGQVMNGGFPLQLLDQCGKLYGDSLFCREKIIGLILD